MCMWMCVERGGEGEAMPTSIIKCNSRWTSVVSSRFGTNLIKQGGNVKGRPSGSEA